MRVKSCSRQESDLPTADQVSNLTAFIPLFKDPGFCPGGTMPLAEDGYPDESFLQMVSRFLDACYKNGFIVRFDWESWDAAAREYLSDGARLAGADFPQVRRLLTWHVRQNRFARDHLAEMIAGGHVLAILRRLKDLAA